MSKYSYGCIPSRGDIRDQFHQYQAPPDILQSLPHSVDLRDKCPPIQDQDGLGACTGFALSGAFWYEMLQQRLPAFRPSELFIYYNERVKEGTTNSDAGAMIRDGIVTLKNEGVCPEADWPYNVNEYAVKPPAQAYADGKKSVITSYQKIYTSSGDSQMLACLASGKPFVFGITVYSSFESLQADNTGVIPMPKWSDQVLGGHALLAVGYDLSKQWFIFRNSWGTSWGAQGYGYIPFQYLMNPYLTSDLWAITTVS